MWENNHNNVAKWFSQMMAEKYVYTEYQWRLLCNFIKGKAF